MLGLQYFQNSVLTKRCDDLQTMGSEQNSSNIMLSQSRTNKTLQIKRITALISTCEVKQIA